MRLYGDGWYALKGDAREALDFVVTLGGESVGLIESAFGSWGILYWSDRVLFENHDLDRGGVGHAFKAVLRPQPRPARR